MAKTPRCPVIKAEITQDIIDTSVPKNSGHCMIADAVKLAAPWGTHVSADLATIRVTDPRNGLRYTYLMPRFGQVALLDFDEGVKPEPFSITLRGGLVTLSRSKENKPELSEAQKAQRVAASAASREALKKAKVVPSASKWGQPERVGGSPPPKVRTGLRREFGLRAMGR